VLGELIASGGCARRWQRRQGQWFTNVGTGDRSSHLLVGAFLIDLPYGRSLFEDDGSGSAQRISEGISAHEMAPAHEWPWPKATRNLTPTRVIARGEGAAQWPSCCDGPRL
jgi:hypothetical protein